MSRPSHETGFELSGSTRPVLFSEEHLEVALRLGEKYTTPADPIRFRIRTQL
jgi:hypothetical protein